MDTAPTFIKVLLRPTLAQSDRRAIWFTWFSEPHDMTSRCLSVYSSWCVPGGHPSNYGPGPALLNFSDRANTDELTPYSVYILFNKYDNKPGRARYSVMCWLRWRRLRRPYMSYLIDAYQRWSITPYIAWLILWQINQSWHKLGHKCFLIWGDWLSCDHLRGSHDNQSPHIRT